LRDTAYFDGFKESGSDSKSMSRCSHRRVRPPSGREVHMNPEEAMQAFLDLKAERMVPMHYGTFRLSYEPMDEPPERLRLHAEKHGLAERIAFMTEGQAGVF